MATESREASSRDPVFETVRAVLLRVCRERQPEFNIEIDMKSSLVVDLGLDSLSLVEVAVAIEQAFGIERLSLEALGECRQGRDEERLTVASLVRICREQAPARSQAAHPR